MSGSTATIRPLLAVALREFRNRGLGIDDVLKHRDAKQRIERAVAKWQPARVGGRKTDPLVVRLRFLQRRDHLCHGEIDTNKTDLRDVQATETDFRQPLDRSRRRESDYPAAAEVSPRGTQ